VFVSNRLYRPTGSDYSLNLLEKFCRRPSICMGLHQEPLLLISKIFRQFRISAYLPSTRYMSRNMHLRFKRRNNKNLNHAPSIPSPNFKRCGLERTFITILGTIHSNFQHILLVNCQPRTYKKLVVSIRLNFLVLKRFDISKI
jgi:hypothetical protein